MNVMLHGQLVCQGTALGDNGKQGNLHKKLHNPNKPLFIPDKVNEVAQMLDRLKLPSATACGPGDCCCTSVRYTAVWPYDFTS